MLKTPHPKLARIAALPLPKPFIWFLIAWSLVFIWQLKSLADSRQQLLMTSEQVQPVSAANSNRVKQVEIINLFVELELAFTKLEQTGFSAAQLHALLPLSEAFIDKLSYVTVGEEAVEHDAELQRENQAQQRLWRQLKTLKQGLTTYQVIGAKLTIKQQELAKLEQAYYRVIEKSAARIAEYQAEQPFERLTANADRTELFNALNFARSKQQFKLLKDDGNSLLMSISALFEATDEKQLIQAFDYSQGIYEFYRQQIRAFTDTPTRMGLNKWFKSLSEPTSFLLDLKQVKQQVLTHQQALVQQLTDHQDGLRAMHQAHLASLEQVQVKQLRQANQENNQQIVNQLIFMIVLANLVLLLLSYLIILKSSGYKASNVTNTPVN